MGKTWAPSLPQEEKKTKLIETDLRKVGYCSFNPRLGHWLIPGISSLSVGFYCVYFSGAFLGNATATFLERTYSVGKCRVSLSGPG